jgi:hypothetical protein
MNQYGLLTIVMPFLPGNKKAPFAYCLTSARSLFFPLRPLMTIISL